MWQAGWRDRIWSELDRAWDLIIIGGGITGAGILREAARAGLDALLVEGHDFASGTSSRSSKMVHGGLRYLSNFQIKLTLESVRERERLLREGQGLIDPVEFLIANYQGDQPPAWALGVGLSIYDMLALKWQHNHVNAADLKKMISLLNPAGLQGGYRFFDARTDDARLVLRVIREAVAAGGTALNYASVAGLLRDQSGQVHGIQLRDQATGRLAEVKAPVVINATGAWADQLRSHVEARPRLRRLRGSHLIFPRHKLPVTQPINFGHPVDHRPVFVLPWEGVALVGTTDVDHGPSVPVDPHISPAEVDYLMALVTHAFPSLRLTPDDIQSTLSGVRAVIDTGKANPSKESREFVLWEENGLLTVTGGKLTTFRLMAHDALRAVRRQLPGRPKFDPKQRVLDKIEPGPSDDLDPAMYLRLLGRFGADTPQLVAAAQPNELTAIGSTPALWAELRWAARAEGVVHLDDLLLRRVRLGLLLPDGALPEMDRIRAIVQPELGWQDDRWEREVANYSRLWEQSYALP